MCTDLDVLQCVPYPKHETPPQFRHDALAKIASLTVNRDSLFYPNVESGQVQVEILRNGEYVYCAKRATIQKVMEFDYEIGASEGEPSKWALVEITNSDYHGRPISIALYQQKRRRLLPCCEQRSEDDS